MVTATPDQMPSADSPITPTTAVNTPQNKSFWRVYASRNKMGVVGIVILTILVVFTIVGPWLTPGRNMTDVKQIFGKPSWDHPLGFDYAGRDVWWQIAHGGRLLLLISVATALLATVIGVIVGSLCALFGGWFDSLMQLLADTIMVIPGIVLLGVLAAFIRLSNPFVLILIMGLTSWPGLMYAVRAQVLSLKEREYVEAARMLDLPLSHILFREVLPNMASYILIHFVFAITGAVYGQVALYFLGLVAIQGAHWGIMIQEAFKRGAAFNSDGLISLFAPILMIVLLMWSLTLVARSLEDFFNPRLREL